MFRLSELHEAIKGTEFGYKIEGLILYGDDLDIVRLEELTEIELQQLSALVDEFTEQDA